MWMVQYRKKDEKLSVEVIEDMEKKIQEYLLANPDTMNDLCRSSQEKAEHFAEWAKTSWEATPGPDLALELSDEVDAGSLGKDKSIRMSEGWFL